MTLAKWLDERGRGARAALARKAEVSQEAVRLAEQRRLRRLGVAKKISDATGGDVRAVDMLDASLVAAS